FYPAAYAAGSPISSICPFPYRMVQRYGVPLWHFADDPIAFVEPGVAMRRAWTFLILCALLVPLSLNAQQPSSKPQLTPVAETRLLMEGLALSNFKGMDRLLRQKPKDNEDWIFLRGQALLIAETGNLLLLRPPRNSGEPTWQNHATELRAA